MTAGPWERRFVAHALVVTQRQVLLLRRSAGRYLGGFWDIPGGSVEIGETPSQAAVRECFEECGLRVDLGPEVTRQRNKDTEGRNIEFVTVTYLASLPESERDRAVVLSHEHDAHAWVGFGGVEELPTVWHLRQSLQAARGLLERRES